MRRKSFTRLWALLRSSLAALLLVVAAVPAARADTPHHTFWSVKGPHNTVYLLGSIHMLQPKDSDLPPEALRAYASAKALVMELDLSKTSPDDLLGSGSNLETLPAGQTLAGVLGPAAYAKVAARAVALGLDVELLAPFQPWFAAVTIEQLTLAQLGFDAGSGVDMQFAQRAEADHKPIIALETMEQQLGLFAQLSLDQQRQFLLYTLEDIDNVAKDMDAVVTAWRTGDAPTLERQLHEEFDDFPELYRRLVTDRNQRWLPTIAGELRQQQDYLVIVGALHLVGKDGLVALLRRAGFDVVQH